MAGMHAVHTKALHQAQYAGGVDVSSRLIVDQLVQHTHSKRALGHDHALQAQQVKHGAQHAQATGHDGAAVFFQAFQLDAVNVLGAQQLLLQPPSLPTRIPFTLQAMQRDTLQLYTSLIG